MINHINIFTYLKVCKYLYILISNYDFYLHLLLKLYILTYLHIRIHIQFVITIINLLN